jgi:hypothetical protein
MRFQFCGHRDDEDVSDESAPCREPKMDSAE